MAVRYVTLSDLFPTKSRATRYRWRKKGKIRSPDLVINGREFFREDHDPRAEDAPEREHEKATTTAT